MNVLKKYYLKIHAYYSQSLRKKMFFLIKIKVHLVLAKISLSVLQKYYFKIHVITPRVLEKMFFFLIKIKPTWSLQKNIFSKTTIAALLVLHKYFSKVQVPALLILEKISRLLICWSLTKYSLNILDYCS